MKYILTILLLLTAFIANADQRFETETGFCHFAGDRADDDNEIYFANCQNVIDTYDAKDGNGRQAFGTSTVIQTYNTIDKTYPKWMTHDFLGNELFIVRLLRGSLADRTLYRSYTVAANTPCVMVTSNYNAAADNYNRTEYRSDDWNLSGRWLPIVDQNKPHIRQIEFELACRNGVAQ